MVEGKRGINMRGSGELTLSEEEDGKDLLTNIPEDEAGDGCGFLEGEGEGIFEVGNYNSYTCNDCPWALVLIKCISGRRSTYLLSEEAMKKVESIRVNMLNKLRRYTIRVNGLKLSSSPVEVKRILEEAREGLEIWRKEHVYDRIESLVREYFEECRDSSFTADDAKAMIYEKFENLLEFSISPLRLEFFPGLRGEIIKKFKDKMREVREKINKAEEEKCDAKIAALRRARSDFTIVEQQLPVNGNIGFKSLFSEVQLLREEIKEKISSASDQYLNDFTAGIRTGNRKGVSPISERVRKYSDFPEYARSLRQFSANDKKEVEGGGAIKNEW